MISYSSKLSLRFFRWFCNPDYVEDIEGDLLERYDHRFHQKGKFYADRHLLKDVLLLFRPSMIRPLEGTQKLNYYGMFKHNLLITFRGFKRHKTVFGINLIGLVASLTCILFSAIWINDELQKDRHHEDSEKLFQVFSRFNNVDKIRVDHGVTGLIDPEIENQIPQVTLSTVSTDVHEFTLSNENQRLKTKGRFADEDYLKVFNFPLWKGQKDALADPSNILITKSLAKRIFGKEEVIGETLKWHFFDFEKTFQVAGILEDIPSNTSEPFNFILPWTFYHDDLITFKGWGNFYGRVVVKLNDLAHKESVESKINEIFQTNQPSENTELFLTNFSDKYLYSKYENGEQAGGRIEYVYLTLIVALFILIIASINFINLSTAFASLKSKEIGVKKTFGARKSTLAFQFFFESILLSSIAVGIALVLVALLVEPFNQLTGKQLDFVLNMRFIGATLLFIPTIGLIAGLYPAIYLSGIETLTALKAKVLTGAARGAWGRRTLVFVQFTLSIILIIGTMIVGRQMDFALSKNLGYDRDNLLYFSKEGKIATNNDAFIAEVENISGVKMVSESGFSIIPGYQNRTAGISWEGKREDQEVSFWENYGDAQSAAILGLEFVAGNSFNDQLSSNENNVILNETAIQIMGMIDPIGQTITHHSGDKKIIGVVKDFTTESLHNPMEPVIFHFRPEGGHYIIAKIEKGKELQTIREIESVYKKFNPNYPFDVRFIDQDYQAMYDAEMRVANLSNVFSGLAILISCMGLFGLTIFQVQRKVKEIGIKKVLGCSALRLTTSMTFDFTKSVFAALLVAIPTSYVLGSKWLENYADSISLEWWMFALASLLAILIACLTVGTQTFKAANANPINSLRDE